VLENAVAALGREIARKEGELDALPGSTKRTIRVARGTLLNLAGLALAVPTGGLSAILCAAGLWDWAEGIVEDAAVMNRENELRRGLHALKALLDAAEQELENKKKSN
jgi:hypothetical protein